MDITHRDKSLVPRATLQPRKFLPQRLSFLLLLLGHLKTLLSRLRKIEHVQILFGSCFFVNWLGGKVWNWDISIL